MNFQLISPESNGYNYDVRFRESVVIDPGSKVRLNHATLTTNTVVEFDENQTITFTTDTPVPRIIPNSGLTNNPFGSNPAVIPAGTYTFPQLHDKIGLAIEEMLSETPGNLTLTTYKALDPDPPDPDGDSDLNRDIIAGLTTRTDNQPFDFEISSTNSLNATTQADDIGYKKNTTGTDYTNNYAMSDEHFFHLGMFEALNKPSEMTLRTHLTGDNYNTGPNALFFGLYSPEVATGLSPAVFPGRTTGTTLLTVPADGSLDVPASYIGFELVSGSLRCLVAQDNLGNDIMDWDSLNRPIGSMREVAKIDVTEYLNANSTPVIEMSTFIRREDVFQKRPNIYFQIHMGKGADDEDLLGLVFDSEKTDAYIPFSCCVSEAASTVIDYTDPNTANSQIPFAPIVSATIQNDGFREINFFGVDKSTDTATEVSSLIQQYSMTFSSDLAKALSVSTAGPFNPNYEDEENIRTAPWKGMVTEADYILNNRSYSIFLNGIPLGNYKNKENQTDGGFKKQILANLPAPFSTGTNIDQTQTLGNRTTVYEPHIPIESYLNNNEIVVNNFKVEIVDMDDERPATELIKSKINFTIYK
jgi:hypothetical protein